MLDLVFANAQPAGLGAAMVVLLIGAVHVVRRGGPHRRATLPAGAVAHAESFDAAAASELHRARRYDRPLTVISLTTQRVEDVPRLASDLRVSARVSDVVGLVGKSTIIAVLPETAGHEAAGLMRRLADLVEWDVASRAVAGIAAFPRSEVTWIGLCATAQLDARPLADFRALPSGAAELERDLHPTNATERGAEPAFATPSPAHAADPAA